MNIKDYIPKPKLSTIIFAFLLFAVFVILMFPLENLKGHIFTSIYQNTRINIYADDIYPSFFGWPGVGMKNVHVSLPAGTDTIDLSCRKVVARVGLGGLFPPRPSVSMSLSRLKNGGDLYFKFSQGGGAIYGVVEAEEVVLQQVNLPGLPEPVSGRLFLDTSFSFLEKEFSKSTGSLDLKIENFKIPALNLQGIILPPLSFGTIKGKVAIKNGVAELNSIQFGSQDSDIQGGVSGEVRLGNIPINTYLNIVLRITVSERYRANPNSATLISFLDGFKTANPKEYALKWSSTINDMQNNLINAIPQKL